MAWQCATQQGEGNEWTNDSTLPTNNVRTKQTERNDTEMNKNMCLRYTHIYLSIEEVEAENKKKSARKNDSKVWPQQQQNHSTGSLFPLLRPLLRLMRMCALVSIHTI